MRTLTIILIIVIGAIITLPIAQSTYNTIQQHNTHIGGTDNASK